MKKEIRDILKKHFCNHGIHFRKTQFVENGILKGACKTCYREWLIKWIVPYGYMSCDKKNGKVGVK